MSAPIILAIDTSCDDTAAAVVQGRRVLSNVIASQTELHKPYGGVFPTVAKQAHREHLPAAVSLALRRAKHSMDSISAIAVTEGPGLAPALEVGIQHAFKLHTDTDVPVYALNHLEGHVLSVFAQPNTNHEQFTPEFPALSVIISGGNSLFVLVHAIGNYQILGRTLDDAAGECLDKIGRMLGLGYPAGPVMEQFARSGTATSFPFPLPLTTSKTYDLSFSGLKTHARKLLTALEQEQNNQPMSKQQLYDFCASAQKGVFRHLTYKLEKILQHYSVKELWLGGGVAANIELRKQLRKLSRIVYGTKIPLRVPYSRKLCMDNAAMIGVAAGLLLQHNHIEPSHSIDRKPRLQLPQRSAAT